MERSKKRFLLGFIGLSLAALLFAVPELHRGYIRHQYPLSLSLTKSVGLALNLYSEEHNDQIPPNLEALVPEIIPDSHLLAHMTLLTPNASFGKLEPRTVILRCSRPERPDGVIVVRADLSGEVIKP